MIDVKRQNPDDERFKLGEIVTDNHKYRAMIYIGCSNWAIGQDQVCRRGAYKFMLQSKTGNSYYTIYLSPEYVAHYVKTAQQTAILN
ncbi:hypothetical protein [Loigolactobacillus rennini]|uniref:hypothetical protein n=1 Tax=Loigolactobacillus rennini TaxID=238013 RepID=UPI00070F449B|nr:hypothetical protein [Loigolactobacillus rennini]